MAAIHNAVYTNKLNEPDLMQHSSSLATPGPLGCSRGASRDKMMAVDLS